MADEKMNEKLSALMDGELEGQEMTASLQELQGDPAQRQTWQHYHLIGDALRKSLPSHIDGSFASRVSQAIAEDASPVSTVVEFKPKPKLAPQPRQAISKPLAGFALAASVAAVAYLGVGMIAVDEQAAGPSLASTAPQTAVPVMAVSAPVVPLDGIQTVQGQRWNVDTPAVESKLNTYLNDHHNVSGVAAMNNRMLLPNVILVEEKPAQGE